MDNAGIDDCKDKAGEFVKDIPFPLNLCFVDGVFNGVARVTLENGDYAVHQGVLDQLDAEFVRACDLIDSLQEELKASQSECARTENERAAMVLDLLRINNYCRANNIDIEQALTEQKD